MKNDITIFILQNQEMFDHAEFKQEAAEGVAKRCEKLSNECGSMDSVRLMCFSASVQATAALIPVIKMAKEICEALYGPDLSDSSGDLQETDQDQDQETR